jgi:hypothetical protein
VDRFLNPCSTLTAPVSGVEQFFGAYTNNRKAA